MYLGLAQGHEKNHISVKWLGSTMRFLIFTCLWSLKRTIFYVQSASTVVLSSQSLIECKNLIA